MKNSFIALAMSVLVLTFSLGAKAPFDPTEIQNKLVGSWASIVGDGIGDKKNAILTISGNTFSYEWPDGSIGKEKWDGGNKEGTYTVTQSAIVFEASDGTKWSTKYKIGDYQLDLEKGKGAWRNWGRYFQIDSKNNLKKIDGTWKHLHPENDILFVFSGNNFTYTTSAEGIKQTYPSILTIIKFYIPRQESVPISVSYSSWSLIKKIS
ncbi:MAG: hypothetical protein Ta2B_16810 [Termitinemataceae bacterium]|nr:MAG: hypothetical protein Ta2B_16810 [Termitinemataceae bacterium]